MKYKKGFTLIELLVVIAIIGLLASVVLASLNSARTKGRDTRRLADVQAIATAIELYKNDNGGNAPLTSGVPATVLATLVSGGYIPQLPVDPTNSGNYVYTYCNNTATTGCTVDSGAGAQGTFAIRFVTEMTTSAGAAGTYCMTGGGIRPATGGNCAQN